MEKKQIGSSSSSSNNKSSSGSLDHLFGPKNPSTSDIFGSIFPPSSSVGGRRQNFPNQTTGHRNYGSDVNNIGESNNRNKNGNKYESETPEPSYLSSSIYYGGQENYSTTTKPPYVTPHVKKDGEGDDSNGNNSNSTSRGNWWKGSLYY